MEKSLQVFFSAKPKVHYLLNREEVSVLCKAKIHVLHNWTERYRDTIPMCKRCEAIFDKMQKQ